MASTSITCWSLSIANRIRQSPTRSRHVCATPLSLRTSPAGSRSIPRAIRSRSVRDSRRRLLSADGRISICHGFSSRSDQPAARRVHGTRGCSRASRTASRSASVNGSSSYGAASSVAITGSRARRSIVAAASSDSSGSSSTSWCNSAFVIPVKLPRPDPPISPDLRPGRAGRAVPRAETVGNRRAPAGRSRQRVRDGRTLIAPRGGAHVRFCLTRCRRPPPVTGGHSRLSVRPGAAQQLNEIPGRPAQTGRDHPRDAPSRQ